MDNKRIFVFIEKDADGAVKQVSLEALHAGKALADDCHGTVTGVFIGVTPPDTEKETRISSIDELIVVAGLEYAHGAAEAYTAAMEKIAIKYRPAVILTGATALAHDFMPRLACRLDAGLIADCTGFSKDEGGNLRWNSTSLNGMTTVELSIQGNAPRLVLIRQGAFKIENGSQSVKCKLIREEIHIPKSDIRTKLIEVLCESAAKKTNLKDAKIIVSGGRGVGGADGFSALRQLAAKLGAEVGASRSAVDSGWIAKEHQVGKTGQIVRPRLYIACGISGAIQHLEGMSNSDIIIAINQDAHAPIFRIADYGVVGDLHTVIPALMKALDTVGP